MSRRVPPHIMRRRRIAGLMVLALLVSLLWWGITSITALFTPAKPTAAGDQPITECASGVVTVTALVGDGENRISQFDATTKPELWFTLTNNGKVDCEFNAGPKVQFYTIRIGEEIIWTNEQCDRIDLKDQVVTLSPGVATKSVPSPWLRVYSSNEGCGEGQPIALPGIYSFEVKVNGIKSANAEQFSLD
jgi:hypothetical protein